MTRNSTKLLIVGLLAASFFGPAQAGTGFHYRVAARGVQAPPPVVAPAFEAWAIPLKTFGDADFELNAPASESDGAFTYASSDPSIAVITGSAVHILRAGTVTLTASQAGTREFLEGSTAGTLQIDRATPNIAAWVVAAKTVGDADFNLTPPSSTSLGAFTYSSSDPTVAAISGSTVRVLKAGTVTVTAVQASTENYLSGQAVAQLVVNPPPGPTLVGDGSSTVGACSTGVSGCATYDTVTGYELDRVSFSPDKLTASRAAAAAPQIYFTKNPQGGKYYFELTVNKVYGTSYLYFGSKYISIPVGLNRVSVDFDAMKVTIINSTTTTLSFTSRTGYVQLYDNITANFGQSTFRYAVPAGYHAGLY